MVASNMELFDQYFKRADLDRDGRISGAEAVAFFQGSNLPKQVLAQEDVKLMSNMGLEAYTFSISWSRVLPNRRVAVNAKGLKYYNDLIDELVNSGKQE